MRRGYLEFWERYVEEVRERHPEWQPQEPRPKNYNNSRLPVKASVLSALFAWRDKVAIRMWIDSGEYELNRKVFDAFHLHRDAFEAFFEDEVEWDRKEDRRSCQILVHRAGSISDDEQALDEYREWMIDTAETFRIALEEVGIPSHLRA